MTTQGRRLGKIIKQIAIVLLGLFASLVIFLAELILNW